MPVCAIYVNEYAQSDINLLNANNELAIPLILPPQDTQGRASSSPPQQTPQSSPSKAPLVCRAWALC